MRRAVSTAAGRSWKVWSIFLAVFLIGNHRCSMRLSLGEYGGRNSKETPAALAILPSFLDVWKRALSRITTAFSGNSGSRIFGNHSLNTALLHMPVNHSGASNLFSSSAAIMLMRVTRVPGRVAKQRSPLGLRPYAYDSLSSIPVSSTQTRRGSGTFASFFRNRERFLASHSL